MSQPSPRYIEEIQHWARLEDKVDRLTEAVTNLVRVEERQMTHGVRIGEIETRVAALTAEHRALDTRVAAWINRGIGIWGIAVVVWTIYLGVIAPHNS